jgi:hypothetical protein
MVDRVTGDTARFPAGAGMGFSALTLRIGAIGRF